MTLLTVATNTGQTFISCHDIPWVYPQMALKWHNYSHYLEIRGIICSVTVTTALLL